MAEAVVSVALETLGKVLIEEATFLRGVKGQVKGLQTEFGNLQSLLKDADRKQHDSETIRNWIKEIRRLAYRAEDVLEEYVVKAGGSGGKGKGFLNILKRFVCFANEMGILHKIGSEIETIKSEISIRTKEMKEFGIHQLITPDQEETTSDENKRRFIRKTYPHEELQHFVGMEEDIERLVSLLVSDQEISRHPVIGVWGMGGSGKTSVANKVYKHVDVKRYFDSFAWVCITQKCQVESVMQDIFRQLLPEDSKKDTIDELVEQIYKVQMEKRCLIVVDDIWKLDDWKCLVKCFPNHVGISHSKVLLTTRNKKVAEIGCPIQLKGITEDEAWNLLRMKAFAKIDFQEVIWDESEYEKLGRKMINKCDRLPLAVAVLGGILSNKNSLEEWESASKDVNSYIDRGEGDVKEVLGLSYDELPYHLKPCFLSLAFLREDEGEIVQRIYDMWMAEGFIQSKHVGNSETMHDVAKCYMYELQFRSMVQFDDSSKRGGVLSLHDSILDLCRSKAKEEEFLMAVDKGDIISDPRIAYRLVVYLEHIQNLNDSDVLKAVENSISLRSMRITITSNSTFSIINLPKEIFNIPQFKSLRTLILMCDAETSVVCFPETLENLIHLRLFRLMGNFDSFQLESIHKLSFLQTLDFSGTQVLELKLAQVDFCNMRQLRHLYLPFVRRNWEQVAVMRLMNLPQLETLWQFDDTYYNWKDLIHLQKLRTLERCEISGDECLVQIINYICGSNLRLIDITIRRCDFDGQQESDGALRNLLEIPNVTLQLHIVNCKLSKLPRLENVDFSKMRPGLVQLILADIDYIEEDIMQALDKFPNLKILSLVKIRFGGDKMICGAGSFPRLEKLFFFEVVGDFKLKIHETTMPNLSDMRFRDCRGIIKKIPRKIKVVCSYQ